MQEKIEKLRASIAHDEDKIRALTAGVEAKKKKLKELEITEIADKLKEINSDINLLDFLKAVQTKDFDAVMAMMEGEEQNA